MAPSRVITLPRDDDDSACVLIQVTPTGAKPLDVKLVGTEGDAPYATALKHDRVASLRVKNCPASESEWQAILQSMLAQQPTPDIQATVSVQSESSISITIRKQVQGITQRLGSIILKHAEDEAIELFQWCATSTDALAKSNGALADAAAHAQKLEATVSELKAQLDELVAAKQDDETALLQKFRDLLNEKKVKIREQQKIMTSASFQQGQPSSQQPPQPPQTSESQTTRRPAPSRPTKRKTPATKTESNTEDEDDMEVDKIKIEPEDSDTGNTTEATASDDDDEGDDDDDDTGATIPRPSDAESKVSKPPPKTAAERPPPARSLPFARKKAASPKPAPAAAGAGSETESDDEL